VPIFKENQMPPMSQMAMSEGATMGANLGGGIPAFTGPPTGPTMGANLGGGVEGTPALPPPPQSPMPMPTPPTMGANIGVGGVPQPPSPQAPTMGANISSDENMGMATAIGGGGAPPIPSPQAPTMGANLGGMDVLQPNRPTPPQSPTMGANLGGGKETIGGTALTPPTPSATGGGSSALPTASVGEPTMGAKLGGMDVPQFGKPTPAGSTMGANLGGMPDAVPPIGGLGMPSAGPPIGGLGMPDAVPPIGGLGMPDAGPQMGMALDGRGDAGLILGGEGGGGQTPTNRGAQLQSLPTSGGVQFDTAQTGGPAVTSRSEYSTTGGGATAGAQQAQALTSPTGQSLLGATSGADIASQFGFDPGQYGGYFTPISEEMKKAGTEAGYAGMLGEQRAQLRQQAGQSKQGLRASLLQDVMMAQQAGGASGFAGGGAQQQALGLARSGRQLGADQLASQYGRGMYGVRQQIAGRVAAGQQALSKAQQAMYDRALQLQQSGATMGTGTGGGTGTSTDLTDYGSGLLGMTQTDVQVMQDSADSVGTGGSALDPTIAVEENPLLLTMEDERLKGKAYDDMLAQQSAQLQAKAAGKDPSLPAYTQQYNVDPAKKLAAKRAERLKLGTGNVVGRGRKA